ncbi:hypothetical protein QNN00_24690 [Bacillus velezensis]|nr:hypothetical protein [Bacillus velezensis]
MGDDVYRQALQKFKTSETDQEPNDPDSGGKMQDSDYRDASLSLKIKRSN